MGRGERGIACEAPCGNQTVIIVDMAGIWFLAPDKTPESDYLSGDCWHVNGSSVSKGSWDWVDYKDGVSISASGSPSTTSNLVIYLG